MPTLAWGPKINTNFTHVAFTVARAAWSMVSNRKSSIKVAPMQKAKVMCIRINKQISGPIHPEKVHVWNHQRHGVFQSVESYSQHNPDSDSLTNMFTVEHLLFINRISWRRAWWVFVNIALGLSISYVLVCCMCLCLPEFFFFLTDNVGSPTEIKLRRICIMWLTS